MWFFLVVIGVAIYLIGLVKIVKFSFRKLPDFKAKASVQWMLVVVFAFGPFYQVAASNLYLYYLCGTQSGVFVYEHPSQNAGLFLSSLEGSNIKGGAPGCGEVCLDYLFKSEFRYVELYNVKPSAGYLQATGVYNQYSLSNRENPNCELFLQAINAELYKFENRFQGTNKCLVISNSMARKSNVLFKVNREEFTFLGSVFRKVEYLIVEEPDTVLAASVSFFVRMSRSYWLFPHLHKLRCESEHKFFNEIDLSRG